MWSFWLITAGVFFFIELSTSGFLVFWLGLAAIISMIVSFFTASIGIQTAVFVGASILLIISTRPLLNKFLKSKDNSTIPTNIYSIIGKKGIVVEDINNVDYTGKVKVAGELWSATSSEDLAKGTKIEVIEVNGVKLKVQQIREVSSVQ